MTKRPTDFSGVTVPAPGDRVEHYADGDIGTVDSIEEMRPMHWDVRVRWDSDGTLMNHSPDELR